ncbi:hypothetical protein [Corynebacterium glutamicum]|uniref:hypothetical protein n=1 Tax=Corynebacterium glutamicum TaxID=1718 RepID=UPI001468BFE8|nr:hypothetical protein [Corynebacterium glutamicum]GFK19213.1 hypothetical protein KbCgl_17850 [Corynebacterium glutamicum]
MKNALAKLFGIDPNSKGVRLAKAQREHDSSALRALILRRKEYHPDLKEFATLIGVHSDELTDFEHDPMDFDLSFIRAYSHGLEVEVLHFVRMYENTAREDVFNKTFAAFEKEISAGRSWSMPKEVETVKQGVRSVSDLEATS